MEILLFPLVFAAVVLGPIVVMYPELLRGRP